MTVLHECNATMETDAQSDPGVQLLKEARGASIAAISAALTGPLDERLRMIRLASCLTPALAACCLIELIGPRGQWHPVAMLADTPERTQRLQAAVNRGAPPWAGQNLVDHAFRSQTPIFVESPLESDVRQRSAELRDAAFLEALGCRSGMIVPIVLQGQPAGAITLGAVTPGRYDERCRSWMAEVGRRAATAIENARLYTAEREARAAAEAAIRTRDELTALIAHDLRNPLAVVQGQVDILLRQLQHGMLEHARLVDGLRAARAGTTQLGLLLDELNDFAHLRAGQPLQLECELVDLVALARQVAALQQAAARRHAITLEAAVPVLNCFCDGRRVERLLTNLLSNAIKFSPAGGPVRLALAQTAEGEATWATISVTDLGIGIPEDELPSIFAPFHRARNVIGKVRGTGLGLASARAIVAEHCGQLTVASVEGAGSTFTIRLPMATAGALPGAE